MSGWAKSGQTRIWFTAVDQRTFPVRPLLVLTITPRPRPGEISHDKA
jgi:hypothetical protein